MKGDEVYLLKRSILRNTGLAPTLLELGKALQQLIDLGQPIDEVVKCVPPSITTDPQKAIRIAKKALDLNAAPLAVKEAVKERHWRREGKRGPRSSRGEEEPPHGRRESDYSGFGGEKRRVRLPCGGRKALARLQRPRQQLRLRLRTG